MTQEKLPHRKELCLQSEALCGNTQCFFVYTMSETTRLHRVMWSVYFPCGQDAVGTVELKCR